MLQLGPGLEDERSWSIEDAGDDKFKLRRQGGSICFLHLSSPFLLATTEFKFARPCSNWPPTILSMFRNSRPIALTTKFFLPIMLQVTRVWFPSGLKVNSTS